MIVYITYKGMTSKWRIKLSDALRLPMPSGDARCFAAKDSALPMSGVQGERAVVMALKFTQRKRMRHMKCYGVIISKCEGFMNNV